MLSGAAILDAHKKGQIVIQPFNKENVRGSSVDVTLGEWYCEMKNFKEKLVQNRRPLFNPEDKRDINHRWYLPKKAGLARHVFQRHGKFLSNIPQGINPDDRVIILGPGQTILAHTQEFIGSFSPDISTDMSARSSTRRCNITVCDCAGKGDPFYFNRWTLEIKNQSPDCDVVLVVGRRYAQITFTRMEVPDRELTDWEKKAFCYTSQGKYQNSTSLEELMKNWDPEMMMPRRHMDPEALAANTEENRKEWIKIHNDIPNLADKYKLAEDYLPWSLEDSEDSDEDLLATLRDYKRK